MKVSETDIEDLVLAAFAELRVPPMGKLHHSTLARHWQQYRFRKQDLARALSVLIGSGALSTENGGDDLLLVLTPQGHQRGEQHHRRGLQRWTHGVRIGWLSMQRCRPEDSYRVRRPNRHLGRSTDRDSAVLKTRGSKKH